MVRRKKQAQATSRSPNWNAISLGEVEQQVGATLRRWRTRRGMSLAETAPLVREQGVACDGSYLSRMELGTASIPLRTLFAICRVLRVSPRRILSRDFPVTESVLDAMPRTTLRLLLAIHDLDEKLLGAPLNAALVSILESARIGSAVEAAAAGGRK